MVLTFANNETLIADYTTGDAVVTTDPVPVGNANQLYMVLNIHHLMPMGGSPSPSVGFVVEESNDAQTWIVGGITQSRSSVGTAHTTGSVDCAFIRLKITHSTGGSGAGEWSAATFDIHGNLKHS